MTRADVNRLSFIVPLTLSAAAFALVIGNLLAGVAPSIDETPSAHVFQLLIAAEIPIVIAFLATANWRSWRTATLFAAQIAALAVACMPVWLAGY